MTTNQIIPTAFFGLKDFLNTFATESANTERVPSASLYEVENGFNLEVELPGVKKENVEIHIDNDLLSVTATRQKGETEIHYKREFRLSEQVDRENVKATYEDGVLKMEIAKRKQPEAKKIQIL